MVGIHSIMVETQLDIGSKEWYSTAQHLSQTGEMDDGHHCSVLPQPRLFRLWKGKLW